MIKPLRRYLVGYHTFVTEYVGRLKYVTKCKDNKVKQDLQP